MVSSRKCCAVMAVCPFLFATIGFGQTRVVTYVLEDVWLLPDITHPFSPPAQMTGMFEWTFEQGDFENGIGRFLEIVIPWYGSDLNSLVINVDIPSVEMSLVGNFHDLGVDITLFYLGSLSPDQPVTIDTTRSLFEVQRGISIRGHMISGSVVPLIGVCAVDVNGDGRTDAGDADALISCLSGPDQPVSSACQSADLDGDGDADMADYSTLQAAFNCPQS